MGLYRDETGQVFNLDDKFAAARGYSPVDPTEEQQIYAEHAMQPEDGGALGAAHAFGTEFLSGATLGGSDYLLGKGLAPDDREALAQELASHPIASTTGNIAGTVVASLEGAPRNPTGYLSQLAARETEHGLVQGGIKGTARALNAMGVEGAAQSAGQYIGHSAIENKEATAEGLSGALGTGYAFGAGGGGAVLGVSKGTVAARRLFSRVMDGELAAKDAATAWTLAREEALQADKATAQTLQTRLDEIQSAKREALKYRNETRSMTQEERINASAMPSKAGPSGETRVQQTSSVRPEDIGPTPLDEGIAPAEGGMPTSIKKVDYTPEGTQVVPRERVAAPEVSAEPTTALEKQLAETKARVDEGKPLNEPKASKGNASNEIEKMLAEKKAADLGEATKITRPEYGPAAPQYKPTGPTRFGRLRYQLGKKLLPESLADIRHAATSELLSPAIAAEEAKLTEALDELQGARDALQNVEAKHGEGITAEQLKMLRQDNPTNAGKAPGDRARIMESLDNAHEEALMNAKTTGDGRFLEQAQQFEDMMLNLPDEKDVYWKLGEDIKVVERYEKAISKASEVAGDGAHPSAQGLAKGVSEAESDAERKMYDRATRAVDDAEMHGPTQKSPKERVQYAQERQLDAQRKYDALAGQEGDVGADLKGAKAKVKSSEAEKRTMLRAEGKSKGPDIASKLGVWEILDLPGMPKVSDLPVVGPLLGAWLKFRTLKAALGRKMGRVAATGDARAAILASRTRDRIAKAVDRTLGVAEKGTRVAAKHMPKIGAALSQRIYDDGLPDAPLGAPIQTQAATRIRELAAYVNTPNAIEMDVRRQLRDVSDPDLIQAAEQHRRAIMEYLLRNAPKAPEQGMMKTIDWQPSPAESMSLARRWDAVNDPAATWERFEQEHAALSLEAAHAMREVYPQLFSQAQQRVMQQIAANNEMGRTVPYRTRVSLSLFYQMPLDSSLDPENLKITQSVYERKPSSPAYNPSVPGAAPPPAPTAQPAIANPVNISQAFTPTFDRR